MSTKMNWLDRAVAWVDPAAGFRRARARAAAEVLLSYDGAKSGRRWDNWFTSATDSNAEIGPDLRKLRDRSSDLIRNNPHAKRARDIWVNSVVGTGIVPQADTGDDAANKLIDEAFARFCEECDADGHFDFYGLQRLSVAGMFERGESLIRFRNRLPKDQLSVPLQLQALEGDFIDIDAIGNNSGGTTVQGIERDALGDVTGYWIFDRHPGAVGNALGSLRQGLSSKFVPASEIVHLFRKDRPGQEHGVPALHAVIGLLKNMDEMNEAAIVAEKIACCLGLFIAQDDPATGAALGATSVEDGTGSTIEKLRPGMVVYGRPGEKPETITPPNRNTYGEFMRIQQHLMAVGTELLYWQLTGDLSSVNYSTHRAGDRDFRAGIEAVRWLDVIPTFCAPIWQRFIDTAFLAGAIPVRNYGVKWNPPRFLSIDPVKDAQGDLLEMRNGTKTLPQAVAERGYDFRKQVDEIANTFALLDEKEIVLDIDARKVAKTGVAQSGDPNGQGNGQNPSSGN